MNKKNQSCDDGKVAAVMRLINPATTKRDNLFYQTNFVNAPARIGLAFETTMVLRLMVLFRTIGHASLVDA